MKATYRTCRTAPEIIAAVAKNGGPHPLAPAGHDAYIVALAERMAAACEKLSESIDVRISA